MIKMDEKMINKAYKTQSSLDKLEYLDIKKPLDRVKNNILLLSKSYCFSRLYLQLFTDRNSRTKKITSFSIKEISNKLNKISITTLRYHIHSLVKFNFLRITNSYTENHFAGRCAYRYITTNNILWEDEEILNEILHRLELNFDVEDKK